MTKLDNQCNDLRRLYKTTQIYTASELESLTDDEFNKIIDILKIKRNDDEYWVSERVSLVLMNGKAFISDVRSE